MVHIKDGLHRPVGPVSVFQKILVFLLLTHVCGGGSQEMAPPPTVMAMVGDDVVLPCQLEPPVDAVSMTMEWGRPDLEPRFVHVWHDGQELLTDQNEAYKGRASLSINKLKRGDISLRLSTVKISDSGRYRCYIPKLSKDYFVELLVGAVSSPAISLAGLHKSSSGVVLDCESRGWYPEPEVLWLDGEGNLLSAGPTETVTGPDDLYTVSSRVTVEKRHSNSFTCRVQQRTINQTRETHIRLSADLFMVQSSSAIRISICLAVCIVSVGAVVFVVWKWGQNKTKTTNSSTELQLLTEGEGDREKLMNKSEKITYLDKTKEKLDEDLQNNEGELQHVQQVITTLMKQKTDLKNQRERLTSQQQENKIQIEEFKKKIKKRPATKKDTKKKKREENLEKLQKREKEHKEMLENTEKLLESTEEMINTMTERKGKLQRDKEKINKVLKETERHREEIQSQLQSEREEEVNHPITTA